MIIQSTLWPVLYCGIKCLLHPQNGAAEKAWSSNQVWPPVPPAGSWAPDVATGPPGGQRMHHPAMSGPWNESGRVKSLWQPGE